MNRDSDDAMALRVRDALQARADEVRVAPDALGRIRARTGRSRRTWAVTLSALATAAAATAAAVLVLGGGAPRPVTQQVPPATQPPPHAATVARVPIYYVADVAGTPVLYREFHPVYQEAALDTPLPDRIRAAVAIMLAGDAFDPDYGGEWPDTVSVSGVTVDGAVATVDLVGAMPTGRSGATALQQLVWTVTAVAADRGVQLAGVAVRHDAKPWSDAPLTRGPALETLAPVWLISPQQGDTVEGTIDVHIAAVRGTPVRLRARDAEGVVRFDRPVSIVAATPTPAGGTAAVAPTRGEAHERVILPPGRYTLEAYLAGGQSASDDHTITVTAAPRPTTSAG